MRCQDKVGMDLAGITSFLFCFNAKFNYFRENLVETLHYRLFTMAATFSFRRKHHCLFSRFPEAFCQNIFKISYYLLWRQLFLLTAFPELTC